MVELSSTSPPLIVDIHTHLYPPSYVDLLSSRKTVPYIHKPPDASEPRLIILPSDDDASKPPASRGRPIDSSYSSLDVKRNFMTQHNIAISVVSLANPWLDFLDASTAPDIARTINDDLETSCANFNKSSLSTANPNQKLYAFGTLPLSAPPSTITTEIFRLKSLPHIKGIIMGTTGLGTGLDDPALHPIYSALESTSTLIFLHPHYGLPASSFGGEATLSRTGHVLPLALGFPLETTIAITRAFLAGVFDKFPKLQVLLAHSGGTLSSLAASNLASRTSGTSSPMAATSKVRNGISGMCSRQTSTSTPSSTGSRG
jgi:predicted TIM-barrel fold metal-dependent hydrolase